jgi:hypothetical protein
VSNSIGTASSSAWTLRQSTCATVSAFDEVVGRDATPELEDNDLRDPMMRAAGTNVRQRSSGPAGNHVGVGDGTSATFSNRAVSGVARVLRLRPR